MDLRNKQRVAQEEEERGNAVPDYCPLTLIFGGIGIDAAVKAITKVLGKRKLSPAPVGETVKEENKELSPAPVGEIGQKAKEDGEWGICTCYS